MKHLYLFHLFAKLLLTTSILKIQMLLCSKDDLNLFLIIHVMKKIIILFLGVLGLISCKKSYQCNITTSAIPEAPYTTKKFWSDKEMHKWESDNSINGQLAKCH